MWRYEWSDDKWVICILLDIRLEASNKNEKPASLSVSEIEAKQAVSALQGLDRSWKSCSGPGLEALVFGHIPLVADPVLNPTELL